MLSKCSKRAINTNEVDYLRARFIIKWSALKKRVTPFCCSGSSAIEVKKSGTMPLCQMILVRPCSSPRMKRAGPGLVARLVRYAHALFLATTRNTGNWGATCSNAASGASFSIGRCALAPGARCKYAFSTGARRSAATSSRCTSSRRP